MSDLERVRGVGPTTAEKLRKAGFDTIPVLSEADYQTVAKKAGLAASVVQRLVHAAGETVKEIERENVRREWEGRKSPATALEILQIGLKQRKFVSFKQELLIRAMQKPDIRERIVKKVVKELLD